MSEIITLPYLRSLLGLRVRHQGEACTVVEVLETPPCLVLQVDTAPTVIADHFGRPFEYGVRTHTLSVLNEARTALSDALLDLEILD